MRWQEFKLVENKQTEQFKIKKQKPLMHLLMAPKILDDDP